MIKNHKAKISLSIALVFTFFAISNAQQKESKAHKTIRIIAKITAVLGKAAAKATFESVKFTAKNVVVPGIKNVGVPLAKATPPILAKTAKLTAKGIKNGFKALSKDRDEDRPASSTN